MELYETLNQNFITKVLFTIVKRTTNGDPKYDCFKIPKGDNIKDYVTFFRDYLDLEVIAGENDILYISWASNTDDINIDRTRAKSILDSQFVDIEVYPFIKLINNQILEESRKGYDTFGLSIKGMSRSVLNSLVDVFKRRGFDVNIISDNLTIKWN